MQKFALLVLPLLVISAGCQKKAEGQTVAVVNGEEITSSELNGELATMNVPDDADKKQVTSQALERLIDRRLLAEQAKKAGVDRSPEFIARQRKLNEELLIGMLASRQADTEKLPSDAEIAKIQTTEPHRFAKREIWSLDQIRYETPKDPAVLAKISASKSLNDVVNALAAAQIPIQRDTTKILTSAIPSEIYPKLDALPPGEPFIVPGNGRSVASAIASREAAPLTDAAARTEAVNILRRQSSTNLLEQRLKDLRSQAKIDYKEGFKPAK